VKRPFVDLRIAAIAIRLLFIANVVFGGGDDPLALDPDHVRGGKLRERKGSSPKPSKFRPARATAPGSS